MLDAIDGIDRIRYTSPHPKDMREDVIRAHAELPSVCEHIHLPLQSGSSRILKAMRRTYTRERYLDRVALIREHVPDASLTTDIIVGFPGESEADFAETLEVAEQVGYDSAFTFKYSPRPNTPALKLDDAIPDDEKARRLALVNEKQREVSTHRNKRHVGQTLQVMVEGKNPARGQWIGRTSQIKVLNFTAAEGVELKIGSYVNVLVRTSFPNSLVGEMVT